MLTLGQRIQRLSARDRKALALGIWLVLPALAYVWVVRPLTTDFAGGRERLQAQRGLLARELAVVAEAHRQPAQYGAAEAALLHEAPRLFAGTDALAASAGLAGYVTEQAYRSRVFVQGSETQSADSGGDGVLKLGIEVRAVGDLAGLTGWLRSLERGEKLVRVARLSVTPAGQVGGAEPRDDEILAVVIDVEGYSLTVPPEEASDLKTDKAGASP